MIPTNFISISIMSQFAPMETGFAAEPLFSSQGAAVLGPTSVDGNLNVSGVANLDGSAIVRGDIKGRNGALYVSNDTGASEAFIDLRAGTSNQSVVVPTFSIIANARPGSTPSLFISRTNMSAYPVRDSVMLTAFPANLVEIPSTVNVNGLLVSKYVASNKTAGADPANIPSSDYTGYPVFIFNAEAANGFYKIVLKSIPASGGVICAIYDNNATASFEQQVRIYASNGTTELFLIRTNGKQQNTVIAGTYIPGQSQILRAVRIPLESVVPGTIPAAEADALHAATEEAKGFNKLSQ